MKIELEEKKINAISKLMGVGGAGVEALKELFDKAENELSDVRNVDPKGNMGLQTLAAQKAIETMSEIKKNIFPESMDPNTGREPKKEGPRQFQ